MWLPSFLNFFSASDIKEAVIGCFCFYATHERLCYSRVKLLHSRYVACIHEFLFLLFLITRSQFKRITYLKYLKIFFYVGIRCTYLNYFDMEFFWQWGKSPIPITKITDANGPRPTRWETINEIAFVKNQGLEGQNVDSGNQGFYITQVWADCYIYSGWIISYLIVQSYCNKRQPNWKSISVR